MVNVLLYLFWVFSPHIFTIESMPRVNFRLPVETDILVVYKVSFPSQAVEQLTPLNSVIRVIQR